MPRSAALRSDELCAFETPVEEQIRDFLDGRTHGEDVLHALYDHVLEEKVPEHLMAVLRR